MTHCSIEQSPRIHETKIIPLIKSRAPPTGKTGVYPSYRNRIICPKHDPCEIISHEWTCRTVSQLVHTLTLSYHAADPGRSHPTSKDAAPSTIQPVLTCLEPVGSKDAVVLEYGNLFILTLPKVYLLREVSLRRAAVRL